MGFNENYAKVGTLQFAQFLELAHSFIGPSVNDTKGRMLWEDVLTASWKQDYTVYVLHFHHTSQLSDTAVPSPCRGVLDQLEHRKFKAASSEGTIVHTPECSFGTFTGNRISLLLLFFLVFPQSSILLLGSWGLKEVGYVCLMGKSAFLVVWRALKTTSSINNHMVCW